MHHGRDSLLSSVDLRLGEELFSQSFSFVDARLAASFVPGRGQRTRGPGHFPGHQFDRSGTAGLCTLPVT